MDDDEIAQKTNPLWLRQHRAEEIRREVADQELQCVLQKDRRIWTLLTETGEQMFSPTHDRIRVYIALKARARTRVGYFADAQARKVGLASPAAYDAVIHALAQLLPRISATCERLEISPKMKLMNCISPHLPGMSG